MRYDFGISGKEEGEGRLVTKIEEGEMACGTVVPRGSVGAGSFSSQDCPALPCPAL